MLSGWKNRDTVSPGDALGHIGHLCRGFERVDQFRKTHEALKNGRYRGIWMEDGGFYAFLRENKEEKVLVIINNSDEPYVCDDGFWCETEQKICGFVLDKVKQLPAMQGKPFIIKNR